MFQSPESPTGQSSRLLGAAVHWGRTPLRTQERTECPGQGWQVWVPLGKNLPTRPVLGESWTGLCTAVSCSEAWPAGDPSHEGRGDPHPVCPRGLCHGLWSAPYQLASGLTSTQKSPSCPGYTIQEPTMASGSQAPMGDGQAPACGIQGPAWPSIPPSLPAFGFVVQPPVLRAP